jgi:hypothetical protein
MLDTEARDARRTARYLERLMDGGERHSDGPVEVDLDPSVRLAARQLKADLLRVHPSFRFEEGLAGRLAAAAARLEAGLPIDPDISLPAAPARIVALRSTAPATATPAGRPTAPRTVGAATLRQTLLGRRLKRPSFASRAPRPLLVGGVGVASAALSIGAIYVAWRWSHPSPGLMTRAVRAAHANRSSGSRRSTVLDGILGVVS